MLLAVLSLKAEVFLLVCLGAAVSAAAALTNGTELVVVGSSDGNIYALRADNGTLAWSVKFANPEPMITCTVASDSGKVFAGSWDGKLYAMDAANGTVLWTWSNTFDPYSPNTVTSPTIFNGTVFVGSNGNDHKLWAISEATGKLLWKSIDTRGSIFGPPVVYGGSIIAGSTISVFSFDMQTGAALWNYTNQAEISGIALYTGSPTPSPPPSPPGQTYKCTNSQCVATPGGVSAAACQAACTPPSPLSHSDVLVVASSESLYGLDAHSGELKWTAKTPTPKAHYGGYVSAPVVYDDGAYFGSYGHHIYGVDAASGNLRWSLPTVGQVTVRPGTGPNGTVYIGDVGSGSEDARLYAVSAEGKQLWSVLSSTGMVDSTPAVDSSGSKVYVGGDDFSFAAYDTKDGRVLWSFDTHDVVTSSPVVVIV
jgi:outer membrane protein assembly factor BamB